MDYALSGKLKKHLVKIKRKDPKLLQKIIKQLENFQKDERHPSLRTHKLKGELEDYFSISITRQYRMSYRVFYKNNKEVALFFIFGTHDEVYRV